MTNTQGQYRSQVEAVLDLIETNELPVPYTIEWDPGRRRVEVSWMLSEDLDGSQRVLMAFPAHGWRHHAVSTGREPVVENGATAMLVIVWVHPASITNAVQIAD